jgi:hypothetical protein
MTQPAENHTKPAPATKTAFLPLILAALVGGSVVFILSQLQFSMWVEPPDRQNAPPVISTNPTEIDPVETNPTVSPKAETSPMVAASPVVPAVKNGLRVSNQSPYALRVVLLSHQSSSSPSAKRDRPPAHWDFAPSEGSQNGLLLSLPSEKLTLKPGDVLVAFALDGSRRYWGPYIVGETAAPTQARSTLEWQLLLRP